MRRVILRKRAAIEDLKVRQRHCQFPTVTSTLMQDRMVPSCIAITQVRPTTTADGIGIASLSTTRIAGALQVEVLAANADSALLQHHARQ